MALDYRKIILRNAHIIDPSTNTDRVGDLYIKDEYICGEEFPADDETREINLTGYTVTPGLIDFHIHMNFGGSDVGIAPDLMLLPNGITSAVDAGSAGVSNYECFSRYVLNPSLITGKSLLYASNTGQTTEAYAENIDAEYMDEERMKKAFRQFPELIGLKIRMGKKFSMSLDPLKRLIEIASDIGCFISVHMIDLPCDYEDIVPLLRPGDILVHPFQFRGKTILDENGMVRSCIWEAKERGVLFDLACARYNHSLDIVKKAVAQKFYPDFVTSDTGRNSFYERPSFALPYVMSFMIAAGMPLNDVIRSCTTVAAHKMGIGNMRGTLKPGAFADVMVAKFISGHFKFEDKLSNSCDGDLLISPKMTIKDGRILYQSIEI